MGLVLEAGVLAFDQERRRVGDRRADRLDPVHLRLGEIAQHEIMDERLVAGMADAEPYAAVVVADMGGDRAQAVVARVAAADLDPHLGGREVEFVVNDDQRARVELVEAQSLADAAAGFVHEGLRREQHDPLRGDRAFRGEAGKAGAERPDAMCGGDRFERHEADIVAVAPMALARIAESRDDEHRKPPIDRPQAARAAKPLPEGRERFFRRYFLAAGLAAAAGAAPPLAGAAAPLAGAAAPFAGAAALASAAGAAAVAAAVAPAA